MHHRFGSFSLCIPDKATACRRKDVANLPLRPDVKCLAILFESLHHFYPKNKADVPLLLFDPFDDFLPIKDLPCSSDVVAQGPHDEPIPALFPVGVPDSLALELSFLN